jgi:glycosyltransferase involved in cell wall biosynthesis
VSVGEIPAGTRSNASRPSGERSPTVARYGVFIADQDRGRTRSHGIINYSLGLIESVSALLQPFEKMVVIGNAEIAAELGAAVHQRVEFATLKRPRGALERIRLEEWECRRVAKGLRLCSLHFPKGLVPFGPVGVPIVASVHDDIPLQYLRGAFGPRGPILKNAYISARLIHTLRRANTVLTVSAFSAAQLKRCYPAAPVVVTGEGCRIGTDARLPRTTEYEYLVFGSTLPHKSTRETFATIGALGELTTADRPGIVLGDVPPGTVVPRSARRVSGSLSNDAIEGFIRASKVVIFGSRYEGFGLPPFEAWLQGTPSVYPAVEPMASLLAGVPGSYQPGDAASLRSAIGHVTALTDTERSLVVDDIRRRVSWTEPATRTPAAYRAVAGAIVG